MSWREEGREQEAQASTKNKRPGAFAMMRRQAKQRRSRSLMSFIRSTIVILVLLIIVWILISGHVNQRSIVEKGWEFIKGFAEKVSDFIHKLFTEEYLEITPDGIYKK